LPWTEAELVAVSARMNNALKRFGDGWALFFEAQRIAAHGYPPGRVADAASWLVDGPQHQAGDPQAQAQADRCRERAVENAEAAGCAGNQKVTVCD
jgi:type IV secretion system protein TrbE